MHARTPPYTHTHIRISMFSIHVYKDIEKIQTKVMVVTSGMVWVWMLFYKEWSNR